MPSGCCDEDIGIYQGIAWQGLLFKEYINGHLKVEAYSEASYVDDRGDKKSTSNFGVFHDKNLVTWRSNKQSVVARSAEAEY